MLDATEQDITYGEFNPTEQPTSDGFIDQTTADAVSDFTHAMLPTWVIGYHFIS